jgi:DNA-binding protein
MRVVAQAYLSYTYTISSPKSRAKRFLRILPPSRERVRIAGLGSLQVRNRAARMGRNPATGGPIQIKASKKVAFRVTKELKMAI